MTATRDDSPESEYERLFDTLSAIAADLKVPAQEAEDLINDVLVSTLVHRNITDIDVWVRAAFTSAVNAREGRIC